ncbi:MAG: hypothetical protein FWC97_00060 [Treponema sp.]|nr:hypothetical protein [Treponema sp.]
MRKIIIFALICAVVFSLVLFTGCPNDDAPPNHPSVTGIGFNVVSGLQEGSSNVAVNARVGGFTATGGTAPFTFTLTAGTGDTNNGLFTVNGTDLRVGTAALTHGTKYFRVLVTDANGQTRQEAFTLTVTQPGPVLVTGINFEAVPDLQEGESNVAPSARVGDFTATGGTAPFVFTFVTGIGDDNNNLFEIDGDELTVGTTALTYGTKYFRVLVTDANDQSYEDTFTLTVLEAFDVAALIASRIRRAGVALGDLSTVAADINLPQGDSYVGVTWVSSNTAVLSNAGVVTRPSGSEHAELTLTGTFSSAADSNVSETEVWNVRVMREGAVWSEFLNVHFAVDEHGVFRNMAPSGEFFQPTLRGGAVVAQSEREQTRFAQFNYGYFINLGDGGYIDLGPKVGALLRQSEWTIEFFVRVPVNTVGTWLSFGNDENINTTSADNWRGTLNFTNNNMWLRALDHGALGHNQGRQGDGTQNAVPHAVVVGDSLGVAHRIDQWLHISLVRLPNGNIRILRNWNQAMNGPLNTGFGRLATNPIYGSGDPELEDFRFGYLGRSLLVNSGAGGDADLGFPDGSFIYDFRVYSRASMLHDAGAGAGHPDGDNLWDTVSAQLNTAFGFTRTAR